MRIGRKAFVTLAQLAAIAVIFSTVAQAQHGSAQPSIGTFLSAVNSASEEIKALAAEKSVTVHDVHVVNIASFTNDGNKATVAKAIAKNEAGIAALRDALKSYPAVVSALSDAGVSMSQVIAVEVDRGTEVHVFYQ
jgi:hypothetical protein